VWETGYIEGINDKLRGELSERETLYTLQEVKVFVERWRQQYNHRRPYGSLGNRPPAPEFYRMESWGSPLTAAASFGLPQDLVQRTGAAQGRLS
jgi:hypothetical protein